MTGDSTYASYKLLEQVLENSRALLLAAFTPGQGGGVDVFGIRLVVVRTHKACRTCLLLEFVPWMREVAP